MRSLNIEEAELLHRIIAKPDLQPFFLRKAKGSHWLVPLIEHGFFAPENNPKPIPSKEEGFFRIPSWDAISYLVNNINEIVSEESLEQATLVLAIIRDATIYAKQNSFSNYRTWWQFSEIICELPIHLFDFNDINLINYWLSDPYDRGLSAEQLGCIFLPRLFDKASGRVDFALVLMDSLLFFKFIEMGESRKRKEAQFRFSDWHANKIVDKIARLSGEVAGIDAIHIFELKLKLILDELKNDAWSSIWRKAIEEHDQNSKSIDCEDIIIKGYRDCLVGYVAKWQDKSHDYLFFMLNHEFDTFKRIAIYVIDLCYDLLHSIAGIVIREEHFTSNLRHETWNFLRNHYAQLSFDDKSKVIGLIESMEERYDDSGKLDNRATAYSRSIWFSALKEHDSDLKELYDRNVDLAGVEPEHPDFSSYMTIGWASDESFISLETMQSMGLDELIVTINSYKDVDSFRGPNLRGLAKTFKEFVKVNANSLYLEFEKLQNLKIEYIYELVEAYSELWNGKSELLWGSIWPRILNFFLLIVNGHEFWSEENSKQRNNFVANRHWVVGSIASLIESGTKSDEHAFDFSLMPISGDIITVILEKQIGEEFKVESDAVSVSINSPRGKCIEALINHSLRSCRYSDEINKEHESVWKMYAPIYNRELARSRKGEYEFVTLLSNYLPNFLYMSRSWVLENLPQIFDKTNYLQWLCCVQGVSYTSAFNLYIHDFFKANSHYLAILDDKILKDDIRERFLQFIVIAYLHDLEPLQLTDGLMSRILQRKKLEELRQIIWFIWTFREDSNAKLISKINELWPKLLGIFKEQSKEWQQLASYLCQWSVFVDEIDESSKEWLLKIAPFSETNHNSYILLESLARISKRQPFEAQEIWLTMLKNYSYEYPEDSIKEFFSNLIAKGPDGDRKSREIIDKYIKYGTERPLLWYQEVKKLQQ